MSRRKVRARTSPRRGGPPYGFQLPPTFLNSGIRAWGKKGTPFWVGGGCSSAPKPESQARIPDFGHVGGNWNPYRTPKAARSWDKSRNQPDPGTSRRLPVGSPPWGKVWKPQLKPNPYRSDYRALAIGQWPVKASFTLYSLRASVASATSRD